MESEMTKQVATESKLIKSEKIGLNLLMENQEGWDRKWRNRK